MILIGKNIEGNSRGLIIEFTWRDWVNHDDLAITGILHEIRTGILVNTNFMGGDRPPLWSSGQSSWLQIRRPGFDSRDEQKKKFSGSGTGCTQPREYKLRSYLIEK
jgi:hypothetical protein